MDEFEGKRPPITVVLAVYDPAPDHLFEQIQSLRDQSYPISRLVAVIADRSSVALVRDATADAQWKVDYVVPDAETSSYKSFGLGLKRAIELSADDALFALCDQDDRWHPEKLEKSVITLRRARASLVHTDARLLKEGVVTGASLFRHERRVKDDAPRTLLLGNSVTGMTTLFTRETAVASLPFPAQSALFFHHDLWLALVAGVLQGVARLDEGLVDYRQHTGNVVGAITGKRKLPAWFTRKWVQHWVGSYSVAVYLSKCLYLRMQDVEASGIAQADSQRLVRLAPYLAPRALGGRLMLDGVKWALRGRRNHARQSLMFGCVQLGRMVWALRKCLQSGTLQALASFDTKAFARAPGVQPAAIAAEKMGVPAVWDAKSFSDARMSRKFDITVSKRALQRVVILVPSLNPTEIFAGIATAIDIGLELALRGHGVVFVATDMPIASQMKSEAFISNRVRKSASGKSVAFELFCGVTEGNIELSVDDRFVATAWWSAHIADAMIRDAGLRQREFFYLIQDYEPGFYAWGPEFAGARASYDLEYIPIFNTSLLQDYFETLGLNSTDGPVFSFQPAIDISRYARLPRQINKVPRLALYGRPEVSRNLFPVAVEAINAFLRPAKIAPGEIELLSVGLKHPDVRMCCGHTMRSLGKIPWDDYLEFLASIDIGVSLMLSPHPSHPPIEMAAAGARVVTNRFENKDLDALGAGIISVDPTVESIEKALRRVWQERDLTAGPRDFDLRFLGPRLAEMVADLSAEIAGKKHEVAKAS